MARKINTTRTSGSGTLPDGIYQLAVTDAVDDTSKSGNEMITLSLQVIRGGRPVGRVIRDYLIFDDDDPKNEKHQWKIDQFHDALQLEEGQEITCKYYKGKRIYASLFSEEYNGNVNNKIKTYLDPDVARNLLEKQSEMDAEDDDLTAPVYDEDDTRKPAKAGAKRGRPARQAVAEMEDGDEQDMPL